MQLYKYHGDRYRKQRDKCGEQGYKYGKQEDMLRNIETGIEFNKRGIDSKETGIEFK
jgi:hypothetical protein